MNVGILADNDILVDEWLDKIVKFELLGTILNGRVVEVMDTVCAPNYLIVEFWDGRKLVKVGASMEQFCKTEGENGL